MNTRVDRLRESLEEPLLVSNPCSVRYLVGFDSSNAYLLVEEARVQLFTDFRYIEAAGEVEGVELVEARRNTLAHLAELLTGRVGFEAEHLTYAGYETLSNGAVELVPRRGLVERLRAVKDAGELEVIKRAASITNETYERLAGEGFVGRTERELAWRIEELFHELGSDGPAFDVIVAAGPNGARPHADPGERTIEPRQLVLIDAGCSLDGYASDCTRTFATGELPDELRRAYDVCLEAQQAGVAALRPGEGGKDVDAAARRVIEEAGLGEHFRHGLGHGVGLEVHEAPRLSDLSTDTLEAGNVVTVEPGVYLAGRGGVRIEDLVVVGDGGPEVLTTFTKELVTVQ
ncbi:MAG: Xaa-Pro peptidase family protein [Gaiellaceae bacterium]